VLGYSFAFLVRFDFNIPQQYMRVFLATLPILIICRMGAFIGFSLYRRIWRYVSVKDIVDVLWAVLTGSAIFFALIVLTRGLKGYPRSAFLAEPVLTFLLIAGCRSLHRFAREFILSGSANGRQRLLIVGAGDAGSQLAKELSMSRTGKFHAIGFVDDDRDKTGRKIHGIPVLGRTETIGELVSERNIDTIAIALPSADGKEISRIVEKCRDIKVNFTILPEMTDIVDGKVSINTLREVRLEDLLGRDSVELDLDTSFMKWDNLVIEIIKPLIIWGSLAVGFYKKRIKTSDGLLNIL